MASICYHILSVFDSKFRNQSCFYCIFNFLLKLRQSNGITTQFDNLVQTITDNDIYKVGTVIQGNPCISTWIYTNTKTIVTIL
jgi:hypothetical protein